MKASFTMQGDGYGLKPSHRKENHFQEEITVFDGKKEVVNLRIYGTGARNYACVWVKSPAHVVNGSGWAGGYGYHRPSAAAEEAFRAAGFTFDEHFGGCGESAMQDAAIAVAKAAGAVDPWIHISHG